MDGNDISHEQVDMNACDHHKQGLETQIASETHIHPKSEVTDNCESSKNVQDTIEKDVTDVTGSKEFMALGLCSHFLENMVVAHICAWRHFLGV